MSWVSYSKLQTLCQALRNKFTTGELVIANDDKSIGAHFNHTAQDGLVTLSPIVEDGTTPAALWVTDSAANNATELTGGTLSYVTDVGKDTEDYTSLSLVGGVVNVSGKSGAQRRITNVADPVKTSDVATKWSTTLKTVVSLGDTPMLSGSDLIYLSPTLWDDALVRLPETIYNRELYDKYEGHEGGTRYSYAYRLPSFRFNSTPTADIVEFSYYLAGYPLTPDSEIVTPTVYTAYGTDRHLFAVSPWAVTDKSFAAVFGYVSADIVVVDDKIYPKITIKVYVPEDQWPVVRTRSLSTISSSYVILKSSVPILTEE